MQNAVPAVNLNVEFMEFSAHAGKVFTWPDNISEAIAFYKWLSENIKNACNMNDLTGKSLTMPILPEFEYEFKQHTSAIITYNSDENELLPLLNVHTHVINTSEIIMGKQAEFLVVPAYMLEFLNLPDGYDNEYLKSIKQAYSLNESAGKAAGLFQSAYTFMSAFARIQPAISENLHAILEKEHKVEKASEKIKQCLAKYQELKRSDTSNANVTEKTRIEKTIAILESEIENAKFVKNESSAVLNKACVQLKRIYTENEIDVLFPDFLSRIYAIRPEHGEFAETFGRKYRIDFTRNKGNYSAENMSDAFRQTINDRILRHSKVLITFTEEKKQEPPPEISAGDKKKKRYLFYTASAVFAAGGIFYLCRDELKPPKSSAHPETLQIQAQAQVQAQTVLQLHDPAKPRVETTQNGTKEIVPMENPFRLIVSESINGPEKKLDDYFQGFLYSLYSPENTSRIFAVYQDEETEKDKYGRITGRNIVTTFPSFPEKVLQQLPLPVCPLDYHDVSIDDYYIRQFTFVTGVYETVKQHYPVIECSYIDSDIKFELPTAQAVPQTTIDITPENSEMIRAGVIPTNRDIVIYGLNPITDQKELLFTPLMSHKKIYINEQSPIAVLCGVERPDRDYFTVFGELHVDMAKGYRRRYDKLEFTCDEMNLTETYPPPVANTFLFELNFDFESDFIRHIKDKRELGINVQLYGIKGNSRTLLFKGPLTPLYFIQ